MRTGRVVYEGIVRPEWVDYNGHLRDAFYSLIFSFAVDRFMDEIGLDEVARETRQRTIFTLESHVNFLREIKEGAAVEVEGRIVANDSKRIQLYLEMFDVVDLEPVAASEQMLMHVEAFGSHKAIPFDPDVSDRLPTWYREEGTAKFSGRRIGLPAKKLAL